MRLKFLSLSIALLTVISLQAQIKWPAITQQTKPWTQSDQSDATVQRSWTGWIGDYTNLWC